MTVRYRRHPDLRVTSLEGEGVVLHLGARRYFTVSETGLVILEALADARSVDQLVDQLCGKFEVTREHAEKSVVSFLDRCAAASLLIEVDEA